MDGGESQCLPVLSMVVVLCLGELLVVVAWMRLNTAADLHVLMNGNISLRAILRTQDVFYIHITGTLGGGGAE